MFYYYNPINKLYKRRSTKETDRKEHRMTCSELMNLIIAGVTAVATIVAAIAATWTANQSNGIAKRSFDLARLAYEHNQSDKVSVWLIDGTHGEDIVLCNGSDAPIYDTFVGGGFSNKGDGYKLLKGLASDSSLSSNGLNHSLGVVPPGTWIIKANLMMHGMHSVVGATVCF